MKKIEYTGPQTIKDVLDFICKDDWLKDEKTIIAGRLRCSKELALACAKNSDPGYFMHWLNLGPRGCNYVQGNTLLYLTEDEWAVELGAEVKP